MAQDQAFLDALQKLRNRQPPIDHWRIKIDHLLENGIQSLDALYALVDDPNADESLRADGCTIIGSLCKSRYDREKSIIDKHRAEPIILRALASPTHKIAKSALWTLGKLDTSRGNKIIEDIAFDRSDPRGLREDALLDVGFIGERAHIEPLLAISKDQTEQEAERQAALISVSLLAENAASEMDKRIAQVLSDIVFDETLSTSTRGDIVVERLANNPFSQQYLSTFIVLLDHDEVNLRFWAAHAIVVNKNHYDESVLPQLDRAIRHDQTVLQGWWSVGRELLRAMEIIYYRHVMNDESFSLFHGLISSEPEYGRYQSLSWHRKGDERTWIPVPQKSTLTIDPVWLAAQLKQQWNDVQLNERDPSPEAYLLTWRITVKDWVLMGALLFDGYAITLTSDYENDLTKAFMQWYRTIISPEYPLYRYDWAYEGELL